MPIDMNADLGEGTGENSAGLDEALVAVITSANVAGGDRVADGGSIARVCDLAAEHGVAIGAQLSCDDMPGLGFRPVEIDPGELMQRFRDQIGTLAVIAERAGTAVTYVKPHGALYIGATRDPDLAEAIVGAATAYSADTGSALAVLAYPDSVLLRIAHDAGLVAVGEAFADRGYAPDGTLAAPDVPGAVIDDVDQAITRIRRLVRDDSILAIDGTPITVRARSICLHPDTPSALVMARRLRAMLEADRVRVQPFAPPPRET